MKFNKYIILMLAAGLLFAVGHTGQPPRTGIKAVDEHRSYKSFRVDYVKGNLEATACFVLASEINPGATLPKYQPSFSILSFLSIQPFFKLHERSPPPGGPVSSIT